MNTDQIPEPHLNEIFRAEVQIGAPVVIGQNDTIGKRQMIPIVSGIVSGKLNGIVLPGVDSQIIRPDGLTELSARYALQLDDGEHIYIENNGMRRVDPAYAGAAAQGQIVDPQHVYFATVAKFETYSETYRWLERSVIISYATRLPSSVLLRFYEIV